VLIKTTSCDAGVRVDLSCDSCDVLFSPRRSTPQILAAVWEAATARGWWAAGSGPTGGHFCPSCVEPRSGRLTKVAPGVV
jgi:hypothetical protein